MKAKILPYNSKYYGTEIEVEDDDGNVFNFSLWNSAGYEPSDRELDGACTIEEWRENIVLDKSDPWYGIHKVRAKDYITTCDHFESRVTYEFAKKLVELINKC